MLSRKPLGLRSAPTPLSLVTTALAFALLCSGCGNSSGASSPEVSERPRGSEVAPAPVSPEPSGYEPYGPIQGVPDPGYETATPEMKAAYQDCLEGADITANSVVPGSDEYWMMAKQNWNVSSPSVYPKNDETLWACLLAYQVVAEEFPGPYS